MLYAGSTFDVYAAYSTGSSFDASNSTPLMDERPVTYGTSAWTYTPTEYWLPGDTFAFRAIWPANQVHDISEPLSDEVSFTFTTASTQASQVDLLMSDIHTVTTPSPITSMAPVNLRFSHLLCNVRLLVKVDNLAGDDVFKVTGIQVSGMKDKGTYANGGWDVSSGLSLSCGTTYPGGVTLTKSDYTPISGKGLLLIPQVVNGNVKITLNYTVTHNGTTSAKSPTIVVPSPARGRWDAGKIYNYKLDMMEDYQIKFRAPEVEPWGQEQLGGTIIIK